jgi:hypothetical protein
LHEARETVRPLDEERAEFVRRHFRWRADDPTRFDLVLNTDRLSTLQVVDVVLATRDVAGGTCPRRDDAGDARAARGSAPRGVVQPGAPPPAGL